MSSRPRDWVVGPVTHGQTGTLAYRIWRCMKNRCTNPNVPHYGRYGGRGIKVCERWEKFENFFADMGAAPAGMSIDRLDSNGNYEPGNCRWATMTEQNNNRRSNRFIVYAGKRMTLAQVAEQTGLAQSTVRNWVNNGAPPYANRGGKRNTAAALAWKELARPDEPDTTPGALGD